MKEWKESKLDGDLASEMKMEEGPIMSGTYDGSSLSCNDTKTATSQPRKGFITCSSVDA